MRGEEQAPATVLPAAFVNVLESSGGGFANLLIWFIAPNFRP